MESFTVLANEGQLIEGFGSKIRIVVSAEQTGGAFSCVDFTAPPGFRAPPALHRHRDLDWHAHVVSGTVAMRLGERDVTVGAGGFLFIPRGTAFRWWNASQTEPVRWLLTYTPGGFEKYFGELAAAFAALGRPPTQEDLATVVPPLWAKYGIEVVSP